MISGPQRRGMPAAAKGKDVINRPVLKQAPVGMDNLQYKRGRYPGIGAGP